MRGKKAKAIRKTVYAGVENHGYTQKSKQFTIKGLDHRVFDTMSDLRRFCEEHELFPTPTILRDRFRNMYKTIKREYHANEQGWREYFRGR